MKAANYHLNPETMTVTFVRPSDLFATEMPYRDFYAVNFAIQHLSWTGQYKSILTADQWAEAYLMCDGFGPVNREWAEGQSWDWSHVRDSETETLISVADWIARTRWGREGIDVIVNSMIGQCTGGGISPLLIVPGMES